MARSIKPKNRLKGKAGLSGRQATGRVDSKQVYDWIEQKISKTDPKVGAAICPFAKKTLETKAIQVVPGKSDLVDQIDHCCAVFTGLALDIVVIYIQYTITEEKLSDLCAEAHERNPKFAIMYDHPDNDGLHKGVSFSFQKCPLVMIQDLSKLKNAQSKLRRTSYYRTWGLDDNDDMFY